MKYTMAIPCGDCPFRKEGGVLLSRARIAAISSMMLDSQGGTFPCHKTINYSIEGEIVDHVYRSSDPQQVHCAGALIYAEKHDTATQMMRVAERLGLYGKFTDEARASVWDDVEQWLKDGTLRHAKEVWDDGRSRA